MYLIAWLIRLQGRNQCNLMNKWENIFKFIYYNIETDSQSIEH